MASHDDDVMPEETQGYKLSQPKQSLAEYEKMGELEFEYYMAARALVFPFQILENLVIMLDTTSQLALCFK